MLEQIKAVLFDMDGTLVDSLWMWKNIDVEYLGAHGYQVPSDLHRAIEGMSFHEVAVYFKERFAIPSSIAEIEALWIEMAKDKYAHEVTVKPGALHFLRYLKEKGIPAGVATSNSRELLEAALDGRGLRPYFTCCMTANEAGAGKPAPDVYLQAADSLGVDPRDCLVFEDTYAGMLAGKRAGCRVCAVEDAHSGILEEELLEAADYYLTDYEQIFAGSYRKL